MVRTPGKNYSEFFLPNAGFMSFLSQRETENLHKDHAEEPQAREDPNLCEKQIPRFARDDNKKTCSTSF